MQIMEFSKGATFALALTLTPTTADAFADEMRTAKKALLDWKANRGARCDRVMLTVVCPLEYHDAIEEVIGHIYHSETELGPLLQSVDVEVALLKPGGRGRAIKQYRLQRAAVGARKPWWKLW